MSNGVGFRAFRTSSHRPAPTQLARRASVTHTGRVKRRRYGFSISGLGSPVASSAATRAPRGASRRARVTLPYRMRKNAAPVTTPRRTCVWSTVTKTDVNCTSRNQSQSVQNLTIWPAVLRRARLARARISHVRPETGTGRRSLQRFTGELWVLPDVAGPNRGQDADAVAFPHPRSPSLPSGWPLFPWLLRGPSSLPEALHARADSTCVQSRCVFG